MKKIKLGVLGGYRGKSMMEYAVRSDDCTLTAVCDYSKAVLDDCARFFEERQYPVALCSDFESFLSCDMDAVVLANYANEHAPYAVRCLKRGLHVFSEVLPAASLKEAAELCDAVEESGKVSPAVCQIRLWKSCCASIPAGVRTGYGGEWKSGTVVIGKGKGAFFSSGAGRDCDRASSKLPDILL